MTYLDKAIDLQRLMGEGKMMDAFEKYYAENVIVVEPTGEVREGKDAQRKAIQNWAGMVKEMHGGGVGAITSNEAAGVTCVESWVDVTFQDGNRLKMEEVAVQKWDGDQIVHERFYYNIPGEGS
ncbi:MAG: nuclear transport factor 2 family protein [Saprospiraceae bacterium]|nr:nuclear transport factor 2 family protein [Saprospiraceae bacterium]